MTLVWSSKFTRSVKKLSTRKPDLLDQLEAVLTLLESNPYDPRLRTHRLGGDLRRCLACTVSYDLRLVFELVRPRKGDALELHLLNVGSHDEVY